MAKILLINGPNLNLLGQREPDLYGSISLDDIEQQCAAQAEAAQIGFESFQSNAEHELVDKIQSAKTEGVDCIIINPAAFTHTSIAIRDALLAIAIPTIEVHLSNPHAREPFRRQSFISDIAKGIVCGFGAQSYTLALTAAIDFVKRR